MKANRPFSIYNASAGSGKTFTLVKSYLSILLHPDSAPFSFKNILAITFTNKAVAEMKERIIKMLMAFSDPDILDTPDPMFSAIAYDLNCAPKQLHKKARALLFRIVHNYAAFDISTIDGFTHKIIRTFAYDLKLPQNFEVELDQKSVLSEAVDRLVAQAGETKNLTKILVDFAIEKVDNDKSWDLAQDFNSIGQLLFEDRHMAFLNTMMTVELSDFNAIKKQLAKTITEQENALSEMGTSALKRIENAGLSVTDFSGGYLPKYFKKLMVRDFSLSFTAKWQAQLVDQPLYPKRVSEHTARTIDAIQETLVTEFEKTKTLFFNLKFLKAFHKNIVPLSILKALNTTLESIKTEQNKLFIGEFNRIISATIADQPTPFIYERIGETFAHFFIDEFQDTSTMQWQNLIPILANALASDSGTAMLVGDAKQAIYRWRGGKAEQFMDLFNLTEKPFQVSQVVENLAYNFRSFKHIVTFNNDFFTFLATHVFSNPAYKSLYEKASQIPQKKTEGYVELSFLDIEKTTDRNDLYLDAVLQTIQKCLLNGYQQKDLCILVRYKKEARALATFLSTQKALKIISEDGLLLRHSPEVMFVNNLLALLMQPKDDLARIGVLNYLYEAFSIEDKHDFFIKNKASTLENLFEAFKSFGVDTNLRNILELPLYDLTETLISDFHLAISSNAYLQFYLDEVLSFSQKKANHISDFLIYFEKHQDQLSISLPEGQEAIQIMTVHKAKGLEFPVVICPFADLDIYAEQKPKEWLPVDPKIYRGVSHALVDYSDDFKYFGAEGKQLQEQHKQEQELDNMNLLYVALTRPVEQLYIISKNDSKSKTRSKRYSGLFIDYLESQSLWHDSQRVYRFGNPERPNFKKTHVVSTTAGVLTQDFTSINKKKHHIKIATKAGLLWNSKQQEAIARGNLIHSMMAQVEHARDADGVVEEFLDDGHITPEQTATLKTQLLQIVNHPMLQPYFDDWGGVYNERDIINTSGEILRPDRVVVNGHKEAVIIDYKTGREHPKHHEQLQRYQNSMEAMGFAVRQKLLVYLEPADILVIDAMAPALKPSDGLN